MSLVAPRALAPLALMALIFVLSAQSDPGPGLPPAAQILGHALEYAALAALWAWALAPVLQPAWPAAAAISFAYAVLDEYHQSFVPARDADPLDILVDAVGIGLGLLAFRLLRLRATRSRTG